MEATAPRRGLDAVLSDRLVAAGPRPRGTAAQATLAGRIGFDRSDLVTLLDELEYVVRRTDPADRRRKIVAITETGSK